MASTPQAAHATGARASFVEPPGKHSQRTGLCEAVGVVWRPHMEPTHHESRPRNMGVPTPGSSAVFSRGRPHPALGVCAWLRSSQRLQAVRDPTGSQPVRRRVRSTRHCRCSQARTHDRTTAASFVPQTSSTQAKVQVSHKHPPSGPSGGAQRVAAFGVREVAAPQPGGGVPHQGVIRAAARRMRDIRSGRKCAMTAFEYRGARPPVAIGPQWGGVCFDEAAASFAVDDAHEDGAWSGAGELGDDGKPGLIRLKTIAVQHDSEYGAHCW
jgi:hypothetical protein